MTDAKKNSTEDKVSSEIPRGQRLTQIDGLRAIAALSVVAFHYTTRFDQIFHHITPMKFGFQYGYLGVNLFFAISGFVIYMTLDGIRAPLDFVVSRVSRLFPTYWVAVALTWTIVSIVGLTGYGVTWKEGIINLSMLQSFFSVRDVDGVYWSLQVELLFYAWMLLLWVTKLLRYSVPICIGWVLLAGMAALAESVWGVKVSFVLKHFLLLEWIPWFVLGMIAYRTMRERAFSVNHGIVIVAAIVAVAARSQISSTIAAVVVFGLVWAASRGELGFLKSRPLVFFGMISYPLYLVHEQIGWIIIAKLEAQLASPWIAIVVATLCVTALATLLHNTVEVPSSTLIRKAYKNSRYATAALNFSLTSWAIGVCLIILTVAAAFVTTARM
jgi:peptidoglycan/LPS O-acetylase OafA/YrhL